MGPNKNAFFKDPSQHRKSYHPDLYLKQKTGATCSSKQNERSVAIQKLLAIDREVPTPTLTVQNPPPPVSESESSGAAQTVLVAKHNKKTK